MKNKKKDNAMDNTTGFYAFKDYKLSTRAQRMRYLRLWEWNNYTLENTYGKREKTI